MSYANNKLLKTIHSFNVEGNENHDYKKDYLENKTNAKQYVFFPYDNPKINTPEAIRKVVELFPPGSLREQKVYNKWVVAEGLVFNKIPKISYDEFKEWTIRDMVIAIDYGSVHPTVMTPLVLCWHSKTNMWRVFRIETYYHDPTREGTTPTTEYFSNQLQMFIRYLGGKYNNVKLTNIPIDSAAALLVFCLLYTPCIAAVNAIKKELYSSSFIFVLLRYLVFLLPLLENLIELV